MALTRKNIGIVPVYRGEYVQGKMYYLHNIVSYLGSSFICTEDKNLNPPCYDDGGNLVLSHGWNYMADTTSAYKFLNDLEIDVTSQEFEELKAQGLLDENKRYYIYD